MTLYNVHIYREMKLHYGGIEAGSPEDAATTARDKRTEDADSIDDCGGTTTAALVDVADDETYEQSRLIEFLPEDSHGPADAAALLLDLIRHGLLSLEDGDAYCDFDSTIYAFDNNAPDWKALVDAIGWDGATAAIRDRLAA